MYFLQFSSASACLFLRSEKSTPRFSSIFIQNWTRSFVSTTRVIKNVSANAFTRPAINLSATVGFSTCMIASALDNPLTKSTTRNAAATIPADPIYAANFADILAIILAAALAKPLVNFSSIFSPNSLRALEIASLDTFFLAHLITLLSCLSTLLSLKNLSSILDNLDTTSAASPVSLPALSFILPTTSPAFSAAFPSLPPLVLTALTAFAIPEVAFFTSWASILVAFCAAFKPLFPTDLTASSILSGIKFLAFCHAFPIPVLASLTLAALAAFLESIAALKALCPFLILDLVLRPPARLTSDNPEAILPPAFAPLLKSLITFLPPSTILIGVVAIWAAILVALPVILAIWPTLFNPGSFLVTLAAVDPNLLANFPALLTMFIPFLAVKAPYPPPETSTLNPVQFPGLVSTAALTSSEFLSLSSSVNDISAPIIWDAKSGYNNKSAPVNCTVWPFASCTSAIMVLLSLHSWPTVIPLPILAFHTSLRTGNAFFLTVGPAFWYANELCTSSSVPGAEILLEYWTKFAVPAAAFPTDWAVVVVVFVCVVVAFVLADVAPVEVVEEDVVVVELLAVPPPKGPLYLSNKDCSLAAVLPSAGAALDVEAPFPVVVPPVVPVDVPVEAPPTPVIPLVRVTFWPFMLSDVGLSLLLFSSSLNAPPITGTFDNAFLNRETTPFTIPVNTVLNSIGAFSIITWIPVDIRSGNFSFIRSIPSPIRGNIVFLVKSFTWYQTPAVFPVPSGPNHTSVSLSLIALPIVVSVIIGLPFSSYILFPCSSFCWTWIVFSDIFLSNPIPATPPTTGNAYFATFLNILEIILSPSSSSSSELNKPFNPDPRLDILERIPFWVFWASSLNSRVSFVSESLSSGISFPCLSFLIKIGPCSVITVFACSALRLIFVTVFLIAPRNCPILTLDPLANLEARA